MKKKFRFQWGAFLMFLVYGGLFFLLFGRILFIQVTGEAEGKALASLAQSKYARESVLAAERGTIVDRNNELIASDTLSYKLVAVLDDDLSDAKKVRHVDNPEKTAEILATYIPLEKEDLRERLTRSEEQAKEGKKKQVEFGKAGRDLNHETVLKIKEEKLPGIVFIEDKKRFYPNGVFASYLIGFASREEDDQGNVATVGKMGLEATYDKELTGQEGKINYKSDKWGFILPKTEKIVEPAECKIIDEKRTRSAENSTNNTFSPAENSLRLGRIFGCLFGTSGISCSCTCVETISLCSNAISQLLPSPFQQS